MQSRIHCRSVIPNIHIHRVWAHVLAQIYHIWYWVTIQGHQPPGGTNTSESNAYTAIVWNRCWYVGHERWLNPGLPLLWLYYDVTKALPSGLCNKAWNLDIIFFSPQYDKTTFVVFTAFSCFTGWYWVHDLFLSLNFRPLPVAFDIPVCHWFWPVPVFWIFCLCLSYVTWFAWSI